MSARVVSIREFTPKAGQYSLLVSDLPGRGVQTLGVLLLDAESNELHIRLSREQGGQAVLDRLEDWGSGSIRVTDREAVTVRNFERTLSDLYRQHVPVQVMRFRTHLPKYALTVAAGPFLTNPEDIEAEDWIETPAGLRLDENMFVARIQGHSMEPRIPDGSLCVFRKNVVGSRHGKLVLVRDSELADEQRFTVKRYRSEKRETEGGVVQTGLIASANSVSVSTGTSTTGSYMRDLMRALATLGSLSSSQVNTAGFGALVADVGTSLNGVVSAMSTDVGIFGTSQATLTNQQSNLSSTATALTTQLNAVQEVNMTQTISELTSTQSQLQASYRLITGENSMSLLNFLPAATG